MNDKLRDTLRYLETIGFTLVSKNKHIRIKHPKGKIFTCSGSPGVTHAHKELLRDIRRYEKGVYK